MNEASLSHTRWDCTYHIVWIPKYRRKVPCQQSRHEVGTLVRGLFERKGCEVAGGSVRSDHVHACVRIPPKLAVSDVMGYARGKGAMVLRDRHPEVTVEAALPCPTQADAWPAPQQVRYRRLLSRCDYETMVSAAYSPSCMQRRDRYMVDHASLLIAMFDGSAGGTRYTMEYAMRRGIDVVDLPIVEERK